MIACPASDPGYAKHPVHGLAGQRALFLAAISLCRQFRTAIDVGAHIGLWTRMLSQSFSTVYAYEPVQENYDCLLQNIAGRGNVLPQRAAVGGYVGWCGVALPPDTNSGCWHIADGNDTPILTLDQLGLREIDLIKIDVEGAEGLVLGGALHTIERERPVVAIEDNSLGPKHFGARWVDPKVLLDAIGYERAERVRKDEIWVPC